MCMHAAIGKPGAGPKSCCIAGIVTSKMAPKKGGRGGRRAKKDEAALEAQQEAGEEANAEDQQAEERLEEPAGELSIACNCHTQFECQGWQSDRGPGTWWPRLVPSGKRGFIACRIAVPQSFGRPHSGAFSCAFEVALVSLLHQSTR